MSLIKPLMADNEGSGAQSHYHTQAIKRARSKWKPAWIKVFLNEQEQNAFLSQLSLLWVHLPLKKQCQLLLGLKLGFFTRKFQGFASDYSKKHPFCTLPWRVTAQPQPISPWRSKEQGQGLEQRELRGNKTDPRRVPMSSCVPQKP
jgi:hypothetical protein